MTEGEYSQWSPGSDRYKKGKAKAKSVKQAGVESKIRSPKAPERNPRVRSGGRLRSGTQEVKYNKGNRNWETKTKTK